MSYPNYPGYPSYPTQQPQQNSPYPAYPPQPNHAPVASGGGYPGYPPASGHGFAVAPAPMPYPYQQAHQVPAPSPYPSYPSAQAPAGYPQTPIVPAGYPQIPIAPTGYPQTTPQYAPGYTYTTVPAVQQHPSQPSRPMDPDRPTVRPFHPFDARQDGEVLRKAMKGMGTDEKAIINVLCHRTSEQRQQIYMAYKASFGRDLIKDLKSELSGNFENVILALMLPLPDFLATELQKSMAGMGTKDGVLIEILCSRTNHEIRNISASYHRQFGRSLEKDLSGDTSGDFKHLLISLAQGQRDEHEIADIAGAQSDAQRLYSAGENKMGTDEATFNSILATRSFTQLRQIMQEYQKITGHPLIDAVRREFSYNVEDGLVAVLKCAQNRREYFAERLHASMAGAGTHDRQLIRLIVSRSEIDLGNIKDEFQRKYGKTLDSWIKGDLSGDYQKALLALTA